MKKSFLFLLIIITSFQTYSQELNCRISVIRNQIQGTNEELFRAMQQDLFEFLNNRKWTNHIYSNNERIECQIQLNLSSYNGIDKFKGSINVQSARTIFNTNYKSTLFNFKEENEFEFNYTEGQALEFNENTHITNLTSVLAFYVYIIIGLDQDSYGMMAGTEFLQKAKQILNNAQSDPDVNWQAFGTNSQNNRFYLIEHMTDTDNSPLRRFYYRYHRLGLDVMTEKTDDGRLEIASSFQLLKKVFNRKADSYFLKILLFTKLDEIAKIFSAVEVPMQQKTQVYNILKEIDPVNPKIDKIMERQN